jgi:hypothetical protein
MYARLTTYIALVATLFFNLSTAEAHSAPRAPNRANEVRTEFLRQANAPSGLIRSALDAHRVDRANGFCDEACVLPSPVTNSDIVVIETARSVYTGKILPNGFDPGYDQRTFTVFVKTTAISYGGRITDMETVPFSCKLEAADEIAPASQVLCEKAF